MANDTNEFWGKQAEPFRAFFDMQGEAMREMFGQMTPQGLSGAIPSATMAPGDMAEWAKVAGELQRMWLEFVQERAQKDMAGANPMDPAQWMLMTQSLAKQVPMAPLESAQKMAGDAMQMWQSVFTRFMAGGDPEDKPDLPRKDRRFADPAWQDHPAFALLHQTYLMLAEYFTKAARDVEGIAPDKRKQLEFATTMLVEAMSPDNFLLTNPVVMKRTIETKGQNLVRGMQHLINDLRRGQLTHTDSDAFTLGENLAATPGKVVHETPLYQLVQYSPSTEEVYETPLVIFPPWINRFYILDLTPKKSFIKWAVDQGITVFVVSWKSADASMKDVVWDDYIRSQIEAIDHVRDRLNVPSVHTIGYCVAGTTLAATLAVLARRDEADKVKSATFFTAQVDFEKSGELKTFIDDGQLEMIGKLSSEGYLDGRYLAATFNALRGKDLIWNYVVNNYLLGEDYPAFDLLHWNGDVTNLPAKWHRDYLRDLYRDNKLVVPDALSADGTPIDLTRIETPAYIQAGKEDHIAPAASVWRATRHFKGPVTFLLAGSGHIAGVVNPPAANKYQYWTGDSSAASLKEYVEGADEHPGSWWPHWLDWLESHGAKKVPAKGKRKPGGKGDKVIEDAPGRYVKTR
ncbi:class I poly(R)-hydroxyalkanoic acid synthase [Altererythrobacter arenosus]|uniref:Class I poly(R)-hydroxyalkanoic acid synthase n=1 Tax=Altererythrobacter arenosus TaxID=3032592 RepID=A0ABY8FM75_9SPHN|nr:class I poly(R)-hydroxyalkanoic acid synthase [Altererythrobacter sp. CAU 1644]WFL76123.1 class I poly(R)-hydroxyalkanoic acid synthase [Altererythrobacter sp. CAU 1644]